jgi:hypothetical protein
MKGLIVRLVMAVHSPSEGENRRPETRGTAPPGSGLGIIHWNRPGSGISIMPARDGSCHKNQTLDYGAHIKTSVFITHTIDIFSVLYKCGENTGMLWKSMVYAVPGANNQMVPGILETGYEPGIPFSAGHRDLPPWRCSA